MLTLANPLSLLALPLPLIFAFWRHRRNVANAAPHADDEAALLHPYAELLNEINQSLHPRQHRFPWLWLLGCAAFILALARPQWITDDQLAQASGRDIMLAIDVSGSMRAEDFVVNGAIVNRLEAVKSVVADFIQQRHGDRIGIIIFADDAYTLIPTTQDFSLLTRLLHQVRNGIAGEKTALGDAITLAVNRLRNVEPERRVLVLFTDGANTSGATHPLIASEIAKDNSVRIHAVGIGSHRRVAFPKNATDPIELAALPLDEALLSQLASTTGGQFFLGSDQQALHAIVADIDQFETSPHNKPAADITNEWYWLPLLLGMAMFGLSYRHQQHAITPG